jgi:hypothetical protein
VGKGVATVTSAIFFPHKKWPFSSSVQQNKTWFRVQKKKLPLFSKEGQV